MKKESIMLGIIGLLAGVIITGFVAGQVVNNNNTSMMRMMGMHTDNQDVEADHSKMSMSDMTMHLEGLQDDDYDKAFIAMMIAHHEGAVDMAELSAKQAKHDEIKQLSQEIIKAQEKEISDMKQWQREWGYSSDEMMHHSH